jgi:hypothetical protein
MKEPLWTGHDHGLRRGPGGAGQINVPVVIMPRARLARERTPVGAPTINNTPSLAGTNAMDVTKSRILTGDSIGGVTLTLGGTLRLNITGEPWLRATRTLYGFGTASGAFAAIILATPGLNWRGTPTNHG